MSEERLVKFKCDVKLHAEDIIEEETHINVPEDTTKAEKTPEDVVESIALDWLMRGGIETEKEDRRYGYIKLTEDNFDINCEILDSSGPLE